MHLPKNNVNFKSIESVLVTENKFITDLLRRSCIPERKEFENSDIEEESNGKFREENVFKKKERAKSLIELQQRLDALKGKKKQSYKQKLAKKGLKNRLKKKVQQDQRNAEKKKERAAKETKPIEQEDTKIEETKEQKQVFNKDNKIVFSKIEFDKEKKNKHTKQKEDPKTLLHKLEKQKEFIEKLKESGDTWKAVEIKEKSAWKNALAKAGGEKVKDDPILLKKSVKKVEQKKRSSKKKWEKRIENVEKAKKEKQAKRKENIMARKKDKKMNKMKKAVKRGKVIPGF